MGIRHAFRKRGIIHIREAQSLSSFGTFNVRTMTYHCNKYGRVDSSMQKDDESALANLAIDVWVSEPNEIHSPVYNSLSGLVEPDRKTLRTPLATGFWREYNEWRERVTVAQRLKRIGDILLLTEEIRNPLIKEEAIAEAGRAFANMGRNELALTQYRKGLEINSRNPFFRREEAFHLNRVGRVDEAIVKIESILADNPNDIDTISYLGRIYKEMWMDSWKWVSNHEKRLQTAFNSYHWLIKAIDTYMRGYRVNLNNYYPAVNALTLSTILIDLANRYGDPENRVPEIEKVDSDLEELRGSLLFALETFSDEEKADYWTLVSMAELKVLTAKETDEVARAYRKALTASRRNAFFLQSSRAQLEMFTSLEIRPEFVEAGVQVITDELSRIRKEEIAQKTGKPGNGGIEAPKDRTGGVFVFTGYMISNPAKNENQFPPE
jgi:tetratricopeptide (TPR) repeat protein